MLLRYAVAGTLCFLIGFGANKMWRIGHAKAVASTDLTHYFQTGDDRRAIWNLSRVRPAVVMLGDSLTDAIDWPSFTGCLAVSGRGRGGEYSGHLLHRIGDIVDLKPKAVVLLVGVNDLTMGTDLEDVAKTIGDIVARLRAASIRVIRIPVLPVTSGYREGPGVTNERIDRLNVLIDRALAKQTVETLDLRPQLSMPDGSLRPELSTDGLHLNADAYTIWRRGLDPIIAHYCN